MKILRLYLKNFAHILSGVGKYEIDLDFRDTHKTINVLVGKMGSGKDLVRLLYLVIYSHWQHLDL